MALRKTEYTVTVYSDTGFNGLDIPRTGQVLETAPKRVYADSYYVREDIDLPQISINDSYHNLADVDYVKLTPKTTQPGEPVAFYYFAKPHAAAGGTTELSLELDALTTMGGAGNIDYISGWQERGHIAKNEDVLFGNCAAEDWAPSQPLKCINYTVLNSSHPAITNPTEDLQIVISNIDLVKLGKQQGVAVVAGGEVDPTTGEVTNPTMYVPSVEVPENATLFTLMASVDGPTPESISSLSIPNTCAYDATNPTIIEGMKKLYSCGQLQLTASYTIPKEYVIETISGIAIPYTSCTEDGLYTTITGTINHILFNNAPFEYTEDSYVPKNKKVYSTFRTYTIANMASGACSTKEAYLLKYQNNTAPCIDILADPVSTGKPTARFKSDSTADIPMINSINGANWQNSQVLMEGASGSLWNTINKSFAQQALDRDMYMSNYNAEIAKSDYALNGELISKGNLLETVGSGLAAVGGAIALGVAITQPEISIPAVMAAGSASATGALNFSSSSLGRSRQQIKKELNTNNFNKQMANFGAEQDRIAQQRNENAIGMLKSNSVVAPTNYFSPDPNWSMYGMNKFVAYETRKTLQDLKSEDAYYQRYGYNGIHRPLTRDCFTCRQYYTYVQAFDVNIKKSGIKFGMRVRQKAISQLNSGVRVWAVLPDAQYYETN